MRVLIFEPDYAGHHLPYIEAMLPALLEIGAEVTLALPKAAIGSSEFRSTLQRFAEQCRIDGWMPRLPAGTLASARKRVQLLRASIERASPGHVYIPYADGLAQLLGVMRFAGINLFPRGVESEGLLFRAGFAYPSARRIDHLRLRLSWQAAHRAPFDIIHHLDPIAYDHEQRRHGGNDSGLRLMADPVDRPSDRPGDEIREAAGLPRDGRILGAAGLMDERKGIGQLVRAFASACLEPGDRLLLAGPQSQGIKSLLAGEFKRLVDAGRIICVDRWIAPSEVADIVKAMDVVCAAYPNHVGSVSIIIRAASAGRPVLASSGGWSGRIVPRFGLGTTINPNDTEAFCSALPRALAGAATYCPTPASARLAKFHTIENFRALWTVRLRERLGLPPSPGLRTWESVIEGT